VGEEVRVGLYAAARAAAGRAEAVVAPGTLADVLANLLNVCSPALAEVLPRCSYLLDGVAVHGDPVGVDVPAGSHLDVLPPFAGG
jgi:molybdopterin synthase sulfur carrier subunit